MAREYTISEAAEILGRTRQCVWSLIQRGKLAARRIYPADQRRSGVWRISAAEVARRKRQQPAKDPRTKHRRKR